MKIRLEVVTNVEQKAEAAQVRRAVFGTEWSFELCRIGPNDAARANHLIARILPEDKAIAAVTLLDTTGADTMHEEYGLSFGTFDRVARYTHMAVLEPYRGLNLPLYMLLEARQLYILPNGFTHTWFAFRADHATSSGFCTKLGFAASTYVVHGEQGSCRVLVRNEKSQEAQAADMHTRCFLQSVQPKALQIVPISEAGMAAEPVPEFCADLRWRPYFGLVREDEWVAH